MQYEVPQRPSGVLQMPPVFSPASQWVDTKFQNVVPYVPNTMGNIANSLSGILPNAVALKQKMLQMPVQQAQAQTELEQQKLAQMRLAKLEANPNMIPITTTVGPNAGVSVTPMAISDYDAAGGLSKYGPIPAQTGGGSDQSDTKDTSDTSDSSAEQKPNPSEKAAPLGLPSQGGVPAPPVSQNPNVYGPSFPETPAPTAVQASPKKTSQTSPTPADAVASNGPPYSPSEILDLYQKQFDSRAKHARAEMSMASGNPTGRTIILGDPKLGIPDQPIHPEWIDKYLADNPGAWSPDRSASAPVNLTMASGNVEGAQAVDQASDLANKLATNTLTPSDVVNAGGPLWAAANHAPQAPLPHNAIQALRSQAGGQVFPPRGLMPSSTPSSQPVQATTQKAPSTASTPIDPPPGPKDVDVANDDLYWQHHAGMSKDRFGELLSNPNTSHAIGKAGTTPVGGVQSDIAEVTDPKTGQTSQSLIEPGTGMPYRIHALGPYQEVRYYADGHTATVKNEISEANDKEMMDYCIQNGTGGPNWQTWTPEQKIQAYRQAAAIKEGIHDTGFNDKLLSMGNVLDQAQILRDQIASYSASHPNDPGAVNLRNIVHLTTTNAAADYGGVIPQDWSNKIKGWSGGMLDPSHPDDDLRKMSMAYDALRQAARENQGGEHAPDQGPKQFRQEANIPGLPPLSSSDFYPRLNEYIGRQNLAYENRVDSGIAQRIQMPYSASQRIGAQKFGAANIPGGTNGDPIQVDNQTAFDRLPVGTKYRDGEGIKIKGTAKQ